MRGRNRTFPGCYGKNILKLDISQLETKPQKRVKAGNISSTCTVFGGIGGNSQLASGTDIPDLVAGICQSVATRVASLAKRVGVREVCMSGRRGTEWRCPQCHGKKELGVEIYYDKRAQELGARRGNLRIVRKEQPVIKK